MNRFVEKELAILGRWMIKRFRPFVIGITGSAGKTTTKYFIGELLRASTSSVKVSPGNLNTKTGIPLAILGFSRSPRNSLEWLIIVLFAPIKVLFTFRFEKYLVLEYAADQPSDINKLTEIVQPDIAVITNIGDAHIEIFKSREEIVREKWILAKKASEAVIINKETLEQIKQFALDKINVNLYLLPSIKYAKAENIKVLTNRIEFDLYIANKKFETEFKFFGKHNIDNLELAVFCVHLVTSEDERINSAIKDLIPLEGRGRRFYSKGDILVLDESYNANPASMKAALDILKNINYGRKVAVLGQMAEIGPISDQAHKEIAQYAKEVADFTIGVGNEFSSYKLDRWYPDVSELTLDSQTFLKKGDVVLIKGSRSNELDKFVNYLESK